MATAMLDTLFAPATTPLSLSALREGPAAERPFRDLLSPPHQPQAEAAAPSSCSTQPTCDLPAPAEETAGGTEVREEAEANDDSQGTEAAAAAVAATTPAVTEEPIAANCAEVDVTICASDALPTAEDQTQPATPTADTQKLPTSALEIVGEGHEESPQHTSTTLTAQAMKGTSPSNSDVAAGATEQLLQVEALPSVSTLTNNPESFAELSDVSTTELPETTFTNELASGEQSESAEQQEAPLQRQQPLLDESHATRRTLAAKTATTAQASAPTSTALPSVTSVASLPDETKTPDGDKRAGKRVAEDVGAVSSRSPQANTTALDTSEPTPATGSPALDSSPQAAQTSVSDTAAPRGETPTPTIAPTAATSTERLGALLAQRRSKSSGDHQATALTESQQQRLVQRVARAFDTARMRGEAEIRLRLSPPQLGSMKLELRMESGVMTARLEVETVSAQQALAENLPLLRQRLTEQNIRVEQFDIDLLDRHHGSPFDSPTDQPNSDARRATPRSPRAAQTLPVRSEQDPAREPHMKSIADARLDVLI